MGLEVSCSVRRGPYGLRVWVIQEFGFSGLGYLGIWVIQGFGLFRGLGYSGVWFIKGYGFRVQNFMRCAAGVGPWAYDSG